MNDKLVWTPASKGNFTMKSAYQSLSSDRLCSLGSGPYILDEALEIEYAREIETFPVESSLGHFAY